MELVVDSFAGGGGASLGIAWATGRAPDLAINHDEAALAMHAANHPSTVHMTEDVWKAAPKAVTKGRPVGLLWASPDCKHFSRAKGGKPVEKKIRSLAWVVVRWALEVSPRVIILENVREFADWGPLLANGMPDKTRKGLTFRKFFGRLRGLGYVVEHRNLDAADYGAPTHRRRLFLIARRDGEPVAWPTATHAAPGKAGRDLFGETKPWRTAAECIDWSIPCPSIFERKRPLAEATLRRVAMGVKRYVLDAARPFLVGVGGRAGQSPATGSDSPLGTVTAKADRAVVTPFLAKVNHSGAEFRGQELAGPLATITQTHGETLVCPTLIQVGYGEREGQSPRVPGLDKPLGAVVAGGGKAALVSAFLAKHFGGMVGVPVDTPCPTTTARGTQNQVVAANLVRFNFDDAGLSVESPLPTTLSNNHAALVYSFLTKYFGTAIGQPAAAPLGTVTAKDRFGVVTVTIDGEQYAIVDIGMRMLTPRELARCQGFPDTYLLTGSKAHQVARIGNSVCPIMAKVLVEANYVGAETRGGLSMT